MSCPWDSIAVAFVYLLICQFSRLINSPGTCGIIPLACLY